MRTLFTIAAAAAFASAAAYAGTASSQDKSFIAGVSQGGMFEVAAGKLAADQGGSQDIMDQGNTEAHDHDIVGSKLKDLASADGVSFSDDLNASFTSELDALKAQSGVDFDKLYLKDMLAIHAKDGAAFAKEAKHGGDPALRAFAAETYRIVERHIGELKALPAGPASKA